MVAAHKIVATRKGRKDIERSGVDGEQSCDPVERSLDFRLVVLEVKRRSGDQVRSSAGADPISDLILSASAGVTGL